MPFVPRKARRAHDVKHPVRCILLSFANRYFNNSLFPRIAPSWCTKRRHSRGPHNFRTETAPRFRQSQAVTTSNFHFLLTIKTTTLLFPLETNLISFDYTTTAVLCCPLWNTHTVFGQYNLCVRQLIVPESKSSLIWRSMLPAAVASTIAAVWFTVCQQKWCFRNTLYHRTTKAKQYVSTQHFPFDLSSALRLPHTPICNAPHQHVIKDVRKRAQNMQ